MRNLRSAKANTARIAAEKALTQEPIAEDVARLKDYDALIDTLHGISNLNSTASVVIGLVCLVVASLLWMMRISSVNVHATVETGSITFQLANNWQSQDVWELGTGPIRLEGLGEINLPPEFSPLVTLQGHAWLDVDKAQVTLSNLELLTANKLSAFRSSPATVYLLSTGSQLRGQLHVRGLAAVHGGDDVHSQSSISKSINFEVPVTFPFYGDGEGAVPAQLRFGVKDKIILRDIRFKSLSFSREESGASDPPIFISDVSAGTITIGETGEKIILSEADRVRFGPIEGTITKLEIGPTSLLLSFEGRSQLVSIGAAGFEENKVPTWLSYLYHQERLSFFWGSILFLWSVLWSARQLLVK